MATQKKKFIDFQAGFHYHKEDFTVRPVSQKDTETLRVWKNKHRTSFFHNEIISPQQQIFLCSIDERPIGCLGLRWREPDKVEIFNLICGDADYLGKGLMSYFYQCVEKKIKEARFSEIYLHVLKNNNPAIKWYTKQGFKPGPDDQGSCIMHRFI